MVNGPALLNTKVQIVFLFVLMVTFRVVYAQLRCLLRLRLCVISILDTKFYGDHRAFVRSSRILR
jgi:hypothetical protein